jgi:hypothetical protein
LREKHGLREFENRVLRYLGLRGRGKRGVLRLHNEELSDLYSLPNFIWVIKSRRMGGGGLLASMGAGEVHTGFLSGQL